MRSSRWDKSLRDIKKNNYMKDEPQFTFQLLKSWGKCENEERIFANRLGGTCGNAGEGVWDMEAQQTGRFIELVHLILEWIRFITATLRVSFTVFWRCRCLRFLKQENTTFVSFSSCVSSSDRGPRWRGWLGARRVTDVPAEESRSIITLMCYFKRDGLPWNEIPAVVYGFMANMFVSMLELRSPPGRGILKFWVMHNCVPFFKKKSY